MSDPQSDSSYDGQVEEATVSMRASAKTLNQLSSSGQAAKENRRKNRPQNLRDVVQDETGKEQGNSGSKGKSEGQGQNPKA